MNAIEELKVLHLNLARFNKIEHDALSEALLALEEKKNRNEDKETEKEREIIGEAWIEIDKLKKEKKELKEWLEKEIEIINTAKEHFECTVMWEEQRLNFLKEVLGGLK